MRKYLLAAAAAVAVATPAAARDGAGYFGIEGGILFPKDQDANLDATFVQSAQTPAAGTVAPTGTGLVGTAPTAPAALAGDADLDYKKGYDIDAIAGYDFGMFRIEGEIGYKRSKIDDATIDDAFITGLEGGLNPACPTGVDCDDFVFTDTDKPSQSCRHAIVDCGLNCRTVFVADSRRGLPGFGFSLKRVSS